MIQTIDGKAITSVNELFAVLDDHRAGDPVTLSIWRNGRGLEVKVRLE
ncbi:MAG: PDZ domain-containing protein [Gammaproteobacteria bacterium]